MDLDELNIGQAHLKRARSFDHNILVMDDFELVSNCQYNNTHCLALSIIGVYTFVWKLETERDPWALEFQQHFNCSFMNIVQLTGCRIFFKSGVDILPSTK